MHNFKRMRSSIGAGSSGRFVLLVVVCIVAKSLQVAPMLLVNDDRGNNDGSGYILSQIECDSPAGAANEKVFVGEKQESLKMNIMWFRTLVERIKSNRGGCQLPPTFAHAVQRKSEIAENIGIDTNANVSRKMNENIAKTTPDWMRPVVDGATGASGDVENTSSSSTPTSRPIGIDGSDAFGISKTSAGGGSGRRLQFPASPDGERIHIERDRLHEEPLLPFAIISMLLGLLQPAIFPLDMLQEAIQGQLAFHVLLLQVVKMESLLLVWLVCSLLVAGYVPYASIDEMCCRRSRLLLQRLENHSSSASSLEHAGRSHQRRRCTANCFVCALHILLLLLLLAVGLMLAGNEQANRMINALPARGQLVVDDTERFVRNSEMQIAFVMATSMEIAVDAVEKDLQDAHKLLGEPIKEMFGKLYNLENTFVALHQIQQDVLEISKTVSALKSSCKASRELAEKLQQRLEDLEPLVRNIHQVCAERDAPLCETLSPAGLDVTLNAKELLTDPKLKYLGEIATRADFNSTLFEAEMNFDDLGRRIALESDPQRNAIRKALERHRIDVHRRLRALEEASRSVITSIQRAGVQMRPYLEEAASWEPLRYLTTFVLAIVVFIAWTFLMCGTPCCCIGAPKASPTIIGVLVTSIASIFLWMFGSASLLLGSHGENFVCRPLHDPRYETLTALVDDGGLLVPHGGVLKQRLHLNESVRIADALRAMENNKTVYKAFNLKSLVDVDDLSDYTTWVDFHAALAGVRVQRDLKLLTPSMENCLLDFSNAGGINLTSYRIQLSRPTTGKDLNAFLDQIYSISKYIGDVRTKGRLENLTFKLRDIISNEYKALNDAQDALVYHITALDVLLKPLVKRAEYALGNLTKFQHSINSQLETIAKQHVMNYTNRLDDYLAQFRANVLYEIRHRTAKSGPLWHIFATIRLTLCDGCVDGINAIAFGCYLSILLFVSLQPVLWYIMKHARDGTEENLSAILRRSASEELIHQNPQNWQTPRTSNDHNESSNGVDHSNMEESVWITPRQSYEVYVPPPPPRQPSDTTIAIEQYDSSTSPPYVLLIPSEYAHSNADCRYSQSYPTTRRQIGFEQATNWTLERY